MFINVTSRSIANPDETRHNRMNFDSQLSHKWLRKHIHWAMKSGFTVHLEPVPVEELTPHRATERATFPLTTDTVASIAP